MKYFCWTCNDLGMQELTNNTQNKYTDNIKTMHTQEQHKFKQDINGILKQLYRVLLD